MNTVLKRSGRHFSYCDHILNACISGQFLKIFMYMRTVCIKSSSVAFQIILKQLRLGNYINYIKTEAFYPFVFPEADNFFQFTTDFRVLPVQICLGNIIKMEIPFFQ